MSNARKQLFGECVRVFFAIYFPFLPMNSLPQAHAAPVRSGAIHRAVRGDDPSAWLGLVEAYRQSPAPIGRAASVSEAGNFLYASGTDVQSIFGEEGVSLLIQSRGGSLERAAEAAPGTGRRSMGANSRFPGNGGARRSSKNFGMGGLDIGAPDPLAGLIPEAATRGPDGLDPMEGLGISEPTDFGGVPGLEGAQGGMSFHSFHYRLIRAQLGGETVFDASRSTESPSSGRPQAGRVSRGRQAGQGADGGNSVLYQRPNGLQELYETGQKGIEQSFIISEPPASSGDIVLVGEIGTTLVCREDGVRSALVRARFGDGEGLRFCDPMSGQEVIRIGEVTAIDALGQTLTVKPALYGGILEIRVPAEWLAHAQYPVVIDPPIGDPETIEAGPYGPEGPPSAPKKGAVPADRAANDSAKALERAAEAALELAAEAAPSGTVPSEGIPLAPGLDMTKETAPGGNQGRGHLPEVAMPENAAVGIGTSRCPDPPSDAKETPGPVPPSPSAQLAERGPDPKPAGPHGATTDKLPPGKTLLPNGMLDPRVTTGTVNEWHPAMAIDTNGRIFIAYQYDFSGTDRDIYVARSTDSGNTWAITAINTSTYDDTYPTICCDLATNALYITYTDNQYFKFAKSTNGGDTWTSYAVTAYTWWPSESYPSIAAHNDKVWVYAQHAFSPTDADIRYIRSTNGGSSWQGPTTLVNSTKNEMFPAVTMTSSRVGVAYQLEFAAGDQDIKYAYNNNHQSDTWFGITIAASSVNERWPSISASGNAAYLYIGYTYAFSGTDDDIRIAYSTNGGTAFGATGVEVAGSGANDRYPSMAIDPVTPTKIHLSHYYSTGPHIERAFSTNNGVTWTSYIQATDQPNAVDDFHTTAMAARTYPRVSWQDSRNQGTHGYDIWFSTPGQTYTFQTSPAGRQVRIDGVDYTEPVSFSWPAGYVATATVPDPQTVGTTRYAWSSWYDGSAKQHSITVTDAGDTVTKTATFATQYQVTAGAQTAAGGTAMTASNYATPWSNGGHRWEEISSTGTEITSFFSNDDGFATSAANIGFTFPYYGGNFTQFVPSTNGYLGLGSAAANQQAPFDQTIPPDLVAKPYLANTVYPFSSDLYRTPGTSHVYYQSLTNPNRLVLEYKNIDTFSPRGTLHTFEVILYETGEIKFLYQTINGGIVPVDVGLQGSVANDHLNEPSTAVANGQAYGFQNGHKLFDGTGVNLWVDSGATYFFSQQSRQSSSTERWRTNEALSYVATAAIVKALTYYNQLFDTFSASTASGGTPMTSLNNVAVTRTQFGTSGAGGTIWDGSTASDWCDRASNVLFSAASSGSGATERWQANAGGTQPTFTVTSSTTFSATYWNQLKPTVTLNGTSASNTTSTEAHTQFGSAHLDSGVFTSWSDWSDRASTLTFAATTSLGWTTTDTRTFTVNSAFSATITYVAPGAPPIAQEPARNSTSIGGGGSVQGASGEFQWSAADIQIPGRMMDFVFVRTYRSSSAYAGPMGFGWTHNFDQRLVGANGANVDYFGPTGRKDTFTWNGTGWDAPAGFYDSLSYDAGTDIFTLKDRYRQNQRQFAKYGAGSTYKLRSVMDRNNNTILCLYNGSQQLVTINDTLLRNITLAYTPEGRIDTITDFYSEAGKISPRVVDYTYDANGDLTDVRSPLTADYPSGKTTHYTYTSGHANPWMNHNLTQIRDPKLQTFLINTYGATTDRVNTQQFGDGTQIFAFTYPTSTKTHEVDRAGNETDYEFNANGTCFKVTQFTRGIRPGDPASFITQYTYNVNFERTGATFPRTNQVFYTYDIGNSDPLSRGNVLEVRQDSHLVGEADIVNSYTYEASFKRMKTHTEPRGFVTTYFYDYEEATLGDLNGDGLTSQVNGNMVKIKYPDVVSGQPVTQIIEEKFWYNSNGQLTRFIDGEGNHTAYDYYASGPQTGYLQRVTDDFGVGRLNIQATWTYDTVGNMKNVTDARSLVHTLELNELNEITKKIDPAPLSYEVSFHYDANGNADRVDVQNKDENNVLDPANPLITTSFTFNTLNSILSTTAEVSPTKIVVTTFLWDPEENLKQATYPEGNIFKQVWDERDLPYTSTMGFGSADAATTTLFRDPNGNLSRVEDGESRSMDYQYDGFDRMTRETDGLGHYTVLQYYACCLLLEKVTRKDSTNAVLSEVTHFYDEIKRLFKSDAMFKTSAGAPVGDGVSRTESLYDRHGRLVETTDDNGHKAFISYDGAHRITKIVDHLGETVGNKVEYEYDGNANVTLVTETEYNQTMALLETFVVSFEYDEMNRRKKAIEDPGVSPKLNLATELKFDSRDNLTRVIDPGLRHTTATFDGLNRPLTVTMDAGGQNVQVVRTWDDNSRLKTVVNPNSFTTTYDYTTRNQMKMVSYPNSSTRIMTFDKAGNLKTLTDPNGSVVTYVYNAANLLFEKHVARGAGVVGTTDEFFEYDGAYRLTRAENKDGATSLSIETFAYNTLSMVDSETQKVGANPVHTMTRSFDGIGNRLSFAYPDGTSVAYAWDAVDRLQTLTRSAATLASYQYAGGRVAKRTAGNGMKMLATFDTAKRRTSVRHADSAAQMRSQHDYRFDKAGNVLAEDRPHEGKGDAYVFDGLHQMTNVKYGVPSSDLNNPIMSWNDYLVYDRRVDYDLDGAGDRKKVTDNGVESKYNFVGGTYVPDGVDRYNTIETIVSTPRVHDGNGNVTDDGTYTYEYNYGNELLKAIRKSDSVVVGDYQFDSAGRRVKRVTMAATRVYYHDGGLLVEERDGADGVTAQHVWSVDALVLTRIAGQDYYTHEDGLGSVHLLTDSTGANREKYNVSAFGELTFSEWDPGRGAWNPASGSNVGNRFFYLSSEHDGEIDNSALGDRSYDTQVGRTQMRPGARGGQAQLYPFDPPQSSRTGAKRIFGMWMPPGAGNKGAAAAAQNLLFGNCVRFFMALGFGWLQAMIICANAKKKPKPLQPQLKPEIPPNPCPKPDVGDVNAAENVPGGGLAVAVGAAAAPPPAVQPDLQSPSQQATQCGNACKTEAGEGLDVLRFDGNAESGHFGTATYADSPGGYAPDPVGAPGFAESFIPVWGPGRAAVNDFQTGHEGWGAVNTAAAVTDIFLVKALAQRAARLLGMGAKEVGKRIWESPKVRSGAMEAAEATMGAGKGCAGGAKSLSEYLKHQRIVEEISEDIVNLERALERATGPKSRRPIMEQIEQRTRDLEGHLKEMAQKWPEGRPQ